MNLCVIFLLHGFAWLNIGKADPGILTNNTGAALFKKDSGDTGKSRLMDPLLTSNLLRTTLTGAQSLMNPCTLFDFVRDNVRKSAQKSKSKFGSFQRLVNRETLVECAMPSLRDGISLYRTLFVLQETTNLTVFLDQNKDDIYSNTALRNYSHYYIRAGNNDITQILFIGLISHGDLNARGIESPALEFLAANGLVNHPRQYIEFDDIPAEEATLILEKRQQMAAFLTTQDTFWENDIEYLTDLLTVAFNGPEQNSEYLEMLPKITKVFNHKIMTWDPTVEDKYGYDAVCSKWDAENHLLPDLVVLGLN